MNGYLQLASALFVVLSVGGLVGYFSHRILEAKDRVERIDEGLARIELSLKFVAQELSALHDRVRKSE